MDNTSSARLSSVALNFDMATAQLTGGPAGRSACAEGQRAVGASAASALGSTQSYYFTQTSATSDLGWVEPSEQRRNRLASRAMLWSTSSLKAVRCCGRMPHNDAVGDPDDGQGVVVKRRLVDGRMVASFGGLMTCGSVWSCPRCSAVIAHERAYEIGAAVRECFLRGGRTYLLTLTMRHTGGDRLADLWEVLSGGWRSTVGTRAWTGQKARIGERRGRPVHIPAVMGDAERFDIAGLTRVVEATYGAPADGGHGWHLHIHALVFSASSLEAGLLTELPAYLPRNVDREWLSRSVFARRIYERWSCGLEKPGFGNLTSNAVDLREITDNGSEYVGRYLSKATYDAASKVGMEIGGGRLSKGSSPGTWCTTSLDLTLTRLTDEKRRCSAGTGRRLDEVALRPTPQRARRQDEACLQQAEQLCVGAHARTPRRGVCLWLGTVRPPCP